MILFFSNKILETIESSLRFQENQMVQKGLKGLWHHINHIFRKTRLPF